MLSDLEALGWRIASSGLFGWWLHLRSGSSCQGVRVSMSRQAVPWLQRDAPTCLVRDHGPTWPAFCRLTFRPRCSAPSTDLAAVLAQLQRQDRWFPLQEGRSLFGDAVYLTSATRVGGGDKFESSLSLKGGILGGHTKPVSVFILIILPYCYSFRIGTHVLLVKFPTYFLQVILTCYVFAQVRIIFLIDWIDGMIKMCCSAFPMQAVSF